jgi:hypothetical protein
MIFKQFQRSSNNFKDLQTISKIFKQFQRSSNNFKDPKECPRCSNIFKNHQTISKILKQFPRSSNNFKELQTISEIFKQLHFLRHFSAAQPHKSFPPQAAAAGAAAPPAAIFLLKFSLRTGPTDKAVAEQCDRTSW